MRKSFLFGLALFVFSVTLSAQQPYVLFVSYDAFRWDYLDRGITPRMHDFYEDGVRALSFQPAFPSKTFPNHLSIITGMYPENHGIITNNFENPFTKEKYNLSLRNAVRNRKWYWGEPFWVTAKRYGIKTASFYWPSSSVTDSSYSPDYYKIFDKSISFTARVDTVISWFQMPYKERPHFITLYFCLTDDYGHKYGPNSEKINEAVSEMDKITGYIVDEIERIGMKDSINVIILSDHGMADISRERVINIEKMLPDFNVKYSNSGPMMMIKPEVKDIDRVYEILKAKENHFKVYYREEVPEYFHYSENPFIYPLVLVADLGWSLVDNNSEVKYTTDDYDNKGNHGYDNHELDMHGIFIAKGPAFKKGYKTGTLWNIDVYPLLCKIFNIFPRADIDGKLERIGFILK